MVNGGQDGTGQGKVECVKDPKEYMKTEVKEGGWQCSLDQEFVSDAERCETQRYETLSSEPDLRMPSQRRPTKEVHRGNAGQDRGVSLGIEDEDSSK